MNGAIAEVDHFFRMAKGPVGVSGAAGVAGVSAAAGEAVEHRDGQAVVADGTGEAAVALTDELAVPAGEGEPDFDGDVGVGGGL